MSTTPAIIALADGVRAYFAAVPASMGGPIDATVLVTFGKERWKQLNQGGDKRANRVLFIVGAEDGKGGKYTKSFGVRGPGPARRVTPAPPLSHTTPYNPTLVGSDPRPIIGDDGTYLVSTWAIGSTDRATRSAEEDTIIAEQNLFEWTVRAVQRVARAGAIWEEYEWNTDPKENRFGIERLSTLTLKGVYYDIEHDLAFPTPVVDRGSLTTES